MPVNGDTMKKLFFTFTVLAAAAFAQTNPIASVRARPAAQGKKPAIFGSQFFTILPHVVDGGQLTTQIVVTNSGTRTETWEVDLFNDNGVATAFNITGQGAQSVLTGSLLPNQVAIVSTAGTTAATTVDGWGVLNVSNSGTEISVYEIIRNSVPLYQFAAESTAVTTYGIGGTGQDAGAVVTFDNTSGYLSTIAFTNPDVTNEFSNGDVLDVIVYDASGNQLATHQVTLAGGKKTLFAMTDKWPETANIQGSLFMYPDASAFSPLCPLAFRLLILPNSQTFVTLPTLEYLQ